MVNCGTPMSALSADKEALARLCRRHRIRRLALFGSVLKGSARPDSDIDFLVEFDPNAVPGFLGLAKIEAELTELVGRQVDLRTADELSPQFRHAVERMAEVQFAA
jgi:predicted nucleotidyltransferase